MLIAEPPKSKACGGGAHHLKNTKKVEKQLLI